uniref:Uncharacterized protein n=1 Tax=Arundo donax TaxID=35708 RepID=A0A0A9A005_ARUDO
MDHNLCFRISKQML